MAYNRDIPAAKELISNSQSAIQGNFQTIDSGMTGTGVGFSRNHVTMTDATNGGLHNTVDYYAPVSDPTVGSAPVASLYVKASPAQLFFRNTSGILQLTNLPIVTATPGATGYGIVTPWGIKINWGQIANIGKTTGAATVFQVPFTVQPSLQLTVENAGMDADGSSTSVNALSTTGFTARCSVTPGTHTLFFFAIGT